MDLLFSDQPQFLGSEKRSVFLAGPTPRSGDVASWRPEVIELFQARGFDGIVLAPERRDWSVQFDYDDQIEWELAGLAHASVILFWIPRRMATMPALTTNVEFGYWLAQRPEAMVYGRPEDSEKNKYLDYLFEKAARRKPRTCLAQLVDEAVRMAEGN